MAEGATARFSRDHRKAIPVTCQTHRGPQNFANLLVTRTEYDITLDPHATGFCVITFDKPGASMMLKLLGRWVPLLHEPHTYIDMSPAR